MEQRSLKPIVVPIALLFFGAIPIMIAIVRSFEIPLGALPADSIKYTATPAAMFAHAAAGALFGFLGPLQFGRVLARRFGKLHRVMGRIYVLCGMALAVSGLRLIWVFPGTSTPLLDIARIAASAGLALALIWAVKAARARQIARHSAWMIRSYALGMGAATIAWILFPIYIITGVAPIGLLSDLLFVASWLINIAIAEWVIARMSRQTKLAAS